MGIELTKDSIDLGIVVRDAAASLVFYRDAVGLEHVATVPMANGMTMERLACGDSVIKLVAHATPPEPANPPGGLLGGTGLRYFTISVRDVDAAAQRCADAGARIALGPTELRPGVRIVMVEDPDGNWVEFLQLL